MRPSTSRAALAAVVIAISLASCGPGAPVEKADPSPAPKSALTTATERASFGCALMAGIPAPAKIDDNTSRLIDHYGLELAHALFVSAATAEPATRFARLWSESDPVVDKDAPEAARTSARTAVVERCRREALDKKVHSYAEIEALGCRMALELARERPHLSSYRQGSDAGPDPREPFAEHPYAIGLALTMLRGFLNDWQEPGPDVISRDGTDVAYVAQLASATTTC